MLVNGKPLTKSQLSTSLAEEAGITKATAKTVIDAIASIACAEVKEKGEFTIPGIGKLVISNRSARMGRNPATGEVISIPARKVLKFRVAKACKDSVLG
ncbi:MAG: HU family DNA-binding protein [Candidatus Dadabacteria bacterium]|nr:HU family DNA-binding protein [Candidatus Dadabacteria bacterium]MYB26515.1 HU family DNA-binding protein [Candidatus Dadabacteria bacterium]MYE61598.1 HU family DNA-binding protein [Candidatus Dadabacteria bacterium]MYI73197.1 HU family DNA-binding protein [Candidatus Dadabacteria bacterium]